MLSYPQMQDFWNTGSECMGLNWYYSGPAYSLLESKPWGTVMWIRYL